MSRAYESLTTGDDAAVDVWGANWVAQTFTPTVSHMVVKVSLLLLRTGTPGFTKVSIRATDGSGHPTGSDLSVGRIWGNTLPTTGSEWRVAVLEEPLSLVAGTKYAIVLRTPLGDTSNRVHWRCDSTSPSYTGGNAETSTDSGATWSADTAKDLLFQELGSRYIDKLTLRPTGVGYNQSAGADSGWQQQVPADVVAASCSYDDQDGSRKDVYGANWWAQTFTPTESFIPMAIQLQGLMAGTSQQGWVYIYATDGSGHPTGAALTWGAFQSRILSAAANYFTVALWPEAGITLQSGTKYALVIKYTPGDASNYVRLTCRTASPAYTGGNMEQSTDSGATWSAVDADFTFGVYKAASTGDAGKHFSKVNEAVHDDDTTGLYQTGPSSTISDDLHKIEDFDLWPVGARGKTIELVKVVGWFLSLHENATMADLYARTNNGSYLSLTYGTGRDGMSEAIEQNFYSAEQSGEISMPAADSIWWRCWTFFSVNPYTGVAWTWKEIADLEISAAMDGKGRVTQIYTEVWYSDPASHAVQAM